MSVRQKQSQRVIIVSELFFPEETSTAYILTKIATELEQDFELLILTGPTSYEGRVESSSLNTPIDQNKIVRIRSLNLNKNKLFGRLGRSVMLTLGLAWQVFWRSKRTDCIFAVTNPAPLLVALAIVRKLKSFSLVFLVHDVFPENAVAAGMIRSDNIIYPIIKWAFDWAYGVADSVITIGRDMSEMIARKVPDSLDKITLIENWADNPLVKPMPRDCSMISTMGLSERIVIQYAGNIGRAQGVLEFVDLASSVENDNVQFVFRGSGALSKLLYEATKDRQNFILKGAYSRAHQSDILGACDIGLVMLGPEMYGLGVPSKAYNIWAAGKPILFLGPKNSEIHRLIKSHEIGWAFDWAEGGQLIKFINQLSLSDLPMIEAKGANARKIVETFFTEAVQLPKFSNLFHAIQISAWSRNT
jgi:glycosyltransferase involved in cell wall biosynthesis